VTLSLLNVKTLEGKLVNLNACILFSKFCSVVSEQVRGNPWNPLEASMSKRYEWLTIFNGFKYQHYNMWF
jgi:hypothetical protein